MRGCFLASSLLAATSVLAAPILPPTVDASHLNIRASFKRELESGSADMAAIFSNVEPLLEGLWAASDKDSSGDLSQVEFIDAIGKLGISCSMFTSHNGNCTNLFVSLNTDSSTAGVTKAELAAAPANYPEYIAPPNYLLIAAFTNGAGQVPTNVGVIPNTITSLETPAIVELALTISGPPSSIYPGQRQAMIQFVADQSGVTADAIIATFKLKGAASSDRRQLQSSTAETIFEADIYTPDPAAASAATVALQASLADPSTGAAATAFDGVTVTGAISLGVRTEWEVPFAQIAAVPAILFVVSIVACFSACCVARKRRGDMASAGCCTTGCCSFFAVPAWATYELLSAVLIVASMAALYIRASGLTEVVKGLVRTFLEAVQNTSPFAQDYVSAIPSTVINTVQNYEDRLVLLPILVLVPGLLVAICLFLAAVCPCMTKCQRESHKGSYCCAKCFVFLANLLMLLAFVFYAIFAIIPLTLKYLPDSARAPIDQLNLQCEFIPAQIDQLITDNQGALDLLSSAGTNTDALQTELDSITELAGLASGGCAYLLDLFVEFEVLFLPAFLACCALVFAYVVNNSLCCAAGCCSKDENAANAPPAKKSSGGGGGVAMTSVGLVAS